MAYIETKQRASELEARVSTNIDNAIEARGPSIDIESGRLEVKGRAQGGTLVAEVDQSTAREESLETAITRWKTMTGIKEMTFDSKAATIYDNNATQAV